MARAGPPGQRGGPALNRASPVRGSDTPGTRE